MQAASTTQVGGTCTAAGRKQPSAPPVRLLCDTRPSPEPRAAASGNVGVAGSDLLAPGAPAERGVAGGDRDAPAPSPASWGFYGVP